MSDRSKAQDHDFRAIERRLPEEKKGKLEDQIVAAEMIRNKVLLAFEQGRSLPDRLLKRLTNSGDGGHELAEALRAITLSGRGKAADVLRGEADAVIGAKIDEWRREWQALGGSTRELTRHILGKMTLASYWFDEAFGSYERDLVFGDQLFKNLPVPPAQVRCLDLGSGEKARASLLALDALEKLYGEDAARRVAKNLRAMDLIPRNVAGTQEALSPWGVSAENVFQGDFFEAFPPALQREDIHFIFAPMHTPWYGVIKRDLRTLFRNIERAAAPGAKIMFDTVALWNLDGTPPEKKVVQDDDLADFYAVLVREERERVFGHANPEGMVIPRFPIRDIAPGSGEFIHREVLTQQYIDYILREIKSPLRFVNRIPIMSDRFNGRDQEAEGEGMRWIQVNGLETKLKQEIVYRVRQEKNGTHPIVPLYSLPPEERAKIEIQDEELVAAVVTERLKKIARRWVQQYEQHYLIYEKPLRSEKRRRKKKRGT